MMVPTSLRSRTRRLLPAAIVFAIAMLESVVSVQAQTLYDSLQTSGQSPFMAEADRSAGVVGQRAQFAQYYEDAEETVVPDTLGAGPAAPPTSRPQILIDGKRCCPPCRPGYGPDGYGTGTMGEGTSGNAPGTSDGLPNTNIGDLTPRQFAALDPEVSGIAFGGGGYLDLPFIVNQFRVRYDDAYDNNRPDRAEYFYAKCGCFNQVQANAHARGPAQPEKSIDYQDISTYIEKRFSKRFSMFAEVPVRFINPVVNANAGGLANVNAGLKYALLNRNGRYLTFQLRVYAPSGNPGLGLGNGHVSIEPGLLYWRTINDRLFIQGELLNWTPVGGSNFAGDILQWGGGIGYVAYRRYDPTARSTQYAANLPPQVAPQNYFLITPLLEGVGWSVLGGQEFIPGFIGNTYTPALNVVRSAAGDTIFNIKLGVRFTKGANSLYAGWGHALTQEIWYRNIFRLEYRRFF